MAPKQTQIFLLQTVPGDYQRIRRGTRGSAFIYVFYMTLLVASVRGACKTHFSCSKICAIEQQDLDGNSLVRG